MTDRREIDRIVGAALDEDAPWGDLTSETLIPADATATAELVAREPGVLSGIEVFAAAFRLVDPRIAVEPLAADGDAVRRGRRARARAADRRAASSRAERVAPQPRAAHVGRRDAHRAVRRGGRRAPARASSTPARRRRACAASNARPCATAAGATTGAPSPTP